MSKNCLKFLRANNMMDNLGIRLLKANRAQNKYLEDLLLKERDYILKHYG